MCVGENQRGGGNEKYEALVSMFELTMGKLLKGTVTPAVEV